MTEWIISSAVLIIAMVWLGLRLAARKPKHVISTAAAVVIFATVAVGCTFTGAADDPTETTAPPETSAPTETTEAPTETSAPSFPAGTPEDPYPAGTYVVGTDIDAGTYVFLPNSENLPGYFEYNERQHIKQSFSGHFFWELSSGCTVTVKDCHFFPADDYTVTANPDGSYGPGMYRPGIDLPVGGYIITPTSADTPAVWYRFFSISDPIFHNDYYRSTSAVPESLYLDAALSWGAILLEDCTLTVVEDFVFSVPEPPAAQEVAALPESFDASTLVTPYYQQGVDLVGGGTYYISLPTIYPFSEAAVACQQEIYNTILPTLESYAEESSWTDIRDTVLIPYESIHTARYIAGIGYDVYLYKNTLSIVVWEKNHYDGILYYVFCLDISTGNRLSQETMRNRADIGAEDIWQLLESALISKYSWYSSAGGMDPANANDPQWQLLNKTFTDENIANSQVYITDDGSIYVAAKVYSLAGAPYNSQLLPYKIAGPTTVEGYQALFDDSTEIGYMRQRALTSFYRYPSQMDLSAFFYNDFSHGELTEAEKTFLTGKGFELQMSVQSHSTEEMDTILQAVFQMPLAYSNKVGLDKLTYFPETDSYYSNNNSSNFPDITITRFEELGNNVVNLYYTCGNQIHYEYANQELVATVAITNDGGIRMISNQPPE